MTGIAQLSSLVLPDSAPTRDLPPRATDPAHPAWEHYDRRTLIYDAIWMPRLGIVRVYLPRMFNLEQVLDPGAFRIDANPAKIRKRRTHRRFDVIDLDAGPATPETLSLRLSTGEEADLRINPANRETFAGLNVIYTLMRNERLDWIRDWLVFHQKVQGANAVMITDNGSDRYGLDELAETIASVPGYHVTALLSAPLPWGSRGNTPGADDGKFLQTTLLNLVRDRFLGPARAVLNVDIDELVVRNGDETVFDSVQRWGYATFPGAWRFTPDDVTAPRHRDHVLHDPAGRPCATKYAFRPESWLGRRCLSVHSIEKLNRRLFSAASKFRFLHCRSITTSWKPGRLVADGKPLERDPETEALMDRVFCANADTKIA